VRALQDGAGASVVLLGLDDVEPGAWAVLTAAGLRLVRAAGVDDAVRVLTDQAVQVVIADAHHGPGLIPAVRRRPERAAAHVVVCAALESADELRAALDAGPTT
jgi:hypothetical protein